MDTELERLLKNRALRQSEEKANSEDFIDRAKAKKFLQRSAQSQKAQASAASSD